MDLLPNLISSLLNVAFPVFASYKALRGSDPAQLSPWLMYWVAFGLFALFESYTYFLLGWIPFYAYFRLFFLSYLVLPQTQGARFAYQQYIHPFLEKHEQRIDHIISQGHAKAKAAGLLYIEQLIEFVRRAVFKIPPPPQPPPPAGGNYVQTLLSRFHLPASESASKDFYTFLSAATGTGRSTARNAPAEQLSSRTLIPPSITGARARLNYVVAQLEKLRPVLAALDMQASALEAESEAEGGEDLQKSPSDASFDQIDPVDLVQDGAAGWIPWAWGKKQGVSSAVEL